VNLLDECTHEQQDPCLRTLSDGRRQYGRQCAECGRWQPVSAATRRTFATVRDYDESIKTRYWQQRQEQYHEAWAAQKEARLAEQRANYNARLEQPDWYAKRRLVFDRDEGRCKARLEGCKVHARQVHHVIYNHFGNEPLWELESVCIPCHEQITAMDHPE
jgi:5-methylcytosine-specific restriction endonuclease McrA